MFAQKKTLRICDNGHRFYKSSNCNSCPRCEAEMQKGTDEFGKLSSPAKRALRNKGVNNLEQLSKFSESEILQLHGMGKSSIPLLRKALSEKELSFKHENNKV